MTLPLVGAGPTDPSFVGDVIAEASKPVIEHRQFYAQADENAPWAIQKDAGGAHVIRFELRNGDTATATGGHRAELSGLPFRYAPSERVTARYAFKVELGSLLTSWMLIGQIHQEDAYGSSPIFAIEIDTDDTIFVVTRNNSGASTTQATSATPINRGRWYDVLVDVLVGGSTGSDTCTVTIKDDAGATFLSVAATGQNIGYAAATYNYWKFGCYGDSTGGGDAFAIRYKNMSLGASGAGYLDGSATTAPRTLPTPLLDGLTAPTWAVSPGMEMLSSWASDLAEMDTAVGLYSFVYDQVGNGWGLTQATQADQPARQFSADGTLAAYFAGAGDLMTVTVDNDSSDLIGTSGFYIAAIIRLDGTPDNNATPAANNNPLVLGENSGARKWGITTRDDGDGSPWQVQFFVVDSGGEKVATATASAPNATRILVEAEHTGTAIRIRVDGGSWTTTTAGAITSLAGFPRVGHCGTSYKGGIEAIASWKAPPSDAERATLLARFNAMPT